MTVATDKQPTLPDNSKSTIRPVLKTAISTILVPGTVVGVIPRWLVRRDRKSRPSDSRGGQIAGGISLVVGVLLYIHTAWRFADEGRGTPSPTHEPERLVTGGIYAYVRHPMYVAVLLCIGGQALLYRSKRVLLYGFAGWLISDAWITVYEEPHLANKHGEVYEQYCERVPGGSHGYARPTMDEPGVSVRPVHYYLLDSGDHSQRMTAESLLTDESFCYSGSYPV